MAQAFVSEINDLVGGGTLQILDEAKDAAASKSVNVILIIALFTLGAAVLAAFVLFLKEFFSARVYTVSQCEQNKDLILGLIPDSKARLKHENSIRRVFGRTLRTTANAKASDEKV